MKKTLHTNLSLSQIEDRFYLYIVRESVFSYEGFDENTFIGRLKNKRFHFYYHAAFVRNSFTVFLLGKIIERNDGCDIKYTCRKNLFVILFMLIWLSGVTFVFIKSLLAAINSGTWCVPLITSIFVLIGLLTVFYIPKKSVARLENILNTIVNQ